MKPLAALLVLLVLLLGVDRAGEQVAERVVADQLAGEVGTTPSVEVDGFPFLTQALRGRYEDVRLSADGIDAGLPVEAFRVRLSGVHVPLSQVLDRRVDRVPVDGLDATALVSYADVAGAAGSGLRLAPEGDRVRVSGDLQVLGRSVSASALADVEVTGSALLLTAGQPEVDGAPVSGALARALRGRLDLRVGLRRLPYGVDVTGVSTGPRGVTLSGEARDVVLTR